MAAGLTGYPRANGTWGVRNHVLVMPARAAANLAAQRIAERLAGLVSVAYTQDLGPAPPDDEQRVRRTLAGFCANPNVAASLIVGVTDKDRWLADSADALGQRVDFIPMAKHRGTLGTVEAGRPVAAKLATEAATLKREPMPVEALMLGLECGGSDGLSGITANPALGVASDLLVAAGGTSVLAETPELIGAEHILARRAVSPEVGRRVLSTIQGFEEAVRALGVDVRDAQPSPGNQDGGLTTLEEKSLGAAKKGGDAPVAGVVDFAERPSGRGLYIMDTPGHDIEQMVGMVAGGCQLVAFTTGRGTPTGSPIAPCLKIATNTAIFERMAGDIDLNAGSVLDGEQTLKSMGRRIYEELLLVAGGRPTSSERRGNREFAISRTIFPAP